MAALMVGGLAAGGWFLLERRQAYKLIEVPQQGIGQIPLMVRHDGPKLELRWNTLVSDIANAGGATLTITDGKHHSKLDLDPTELRSGTAYYWPQADHVGFKLETDDGAWGSLQVPAWEVQTEEPEHPAPAREHEDEKPRHRLVAGGKKQSGRAKDPKAAKTVHATRAKHSGEKIPPEWKMPVGQ